ncbi:MAG: hypothetical protein JRJ29_11955 [Deltaproteobacteria bacterium]|nr:hypothetical protein [Deltaproteobacteria bacterium]
MESDIRRIAMTGAGVMGTQIAILAAHRGYEVSAHDVDENAILRSLEAIKTMIGLSWKEPLLSLEEWEEWGQESDLFQGSIQCPPGRRYCDRGGTREH